MLLRANSEMKIWYENSDLCMYIILCQGRWYGLEHAYIVTHAEARQMMVDPEHELYATPSRGP